LFIEDLCGCGTETPKILYEAENCKMYEIQVRKLEPIKVAFIRHTGPYQELGPVHQSLQIWLGKNKIQPNGFVREIGYDNPMQTPPEKCRQEICIPVCDAQAGDGVEIKTLPEVKVASVVHRGGLDFQALGPAYMALMGWAGKEGIKTDYSIITYYTSPANRTDAEVEIALVIP
jgi:AraC family transcriptional regulator